MARCPHCGYKLQLIDVKAECPVCAVNIPNYNWEERLDKDAVDAASGFAAFSRRTAAIKSSLFGSKHRIARFVLTFAPLLFFLFPMFTLDISLPFSSGEQSVSMLSLILSIVNGELDLGAVFSLASLPKTGPAFVALFAAVVFVLLGVAAGVLNFFVLIISGFGYHAKANVVLCAVSIAAFAAAVVCVLVSSSSFASSAPELISVNLSYSLFIGILLFAVNFIMNFTARKSLARDRELADRKYAEELKAALS